MYREKYAEFTKTSEKTKTARRTGGEKAAEKRGEKRDGRHDGSAGGDEKMERGRVKPPDQGGATGGGPIDGQGMKAYTIGS